jgi:spore coat protein U-like protein
MYKKNILSLLGVAALMSSVALAATSTANITPSATVTATCVVTRNPMPFGAYDPLAGTAIFHTSTISVTCTAGMTPPPITMDQGLHPLTSSTVGAPLRQLSNGATGLLAYNLYSDEGTIVAWEGTNGVTSPVPTGSPINMNVFGKIDAGQTTVPAGTYNDTVIVTATF